MKKFLPILVIVLILLAIGAGFGYYKFAGMQQVPGTQGTGVFGSIQDAMSKSLSLQCSFTDETGRQTTAYIKAGAIRADVVGKDTSAQYNNSSMILKDKKLYIWDIVKKQGMMMDIPENTVTPTGTQAGNAPQNAGDVMAMLEKYKNDCKPSVVADSQFTPPSDVVFTDTSKMMQPTGMMPSGIPTGAMPSGMSQGQLQQYMQQYQAH